MTDLSQKILEDIKIENIKPCSKWKFRLRSFFVWLIVFIAAILSGLAASVLIFSLLNTDWQIYKFLGRGRLSHFFAILPYFWIFFFFFFFVLVYFSFKNTKNGYKYRNLTIIFLVIFISFSLGGISLCYGISSKIHSIVEKKMPYIQNLSQRKERIWVQPQKGLLGGEIVDMKNNEVSIKDFEEKIWTVKSEDARWHDIVPPYEGEKVKIIGEQTARNVFEAKEAAPWVKEFKLERLILKERQSFRAANR